MPIPQLITFRKGEGEGGGAPDEESNLLDSIPANNVMLLGGVAVGTGDLLINGDGGEGNDGEGGNIRVNKNETTAGPKFKSMDNLELSRRRNICWSVTLLVIFLAMIGSLAVWRFQNQPEQQIQVTVASRAKHAQKVLNKHYHTQSKRMAVNCEGTVLLMRHCEKTGPLVYDSDGNQHCSYLGTERAQFLTTLFGEEEGLTASEADDIQNQGQGRRRRWPKPSYLFALTPNRGVGVWNFREYETLKPLSVATQTTLQITDPLRLPVQIFDLLQSGQMCGRLAVVSWKHGYIHDLATALGCGPDEGCPEQGYPEDDFDQVWQLKYVFRPTLSSRDVLDETKLEQEITAATENSDSGGGKGDEEWDPDEDDDQAVNTTDNGTDGGYGRRRRLGKKKKSSGPPGPNDAWFIYATIQSLNFDPLSFSASVGDYSTTGVASGGRWISEDPGTFRAAAAAVGSPEATNVDPHDGEI